MDDYLNFISLFFLKWRIESQSLKIKGLKQIIYLKFVAKAESPLPDSNLSTDTSEAHSPVPTPVRPSRPAQPNVAVITLYDKELDENMDHQYKQHKKTSAKKKRNPLSVQVGELIWILRSIFHILLKSCFSLWGLFYLAQALD